MDALRGCIRELIDAILDEVHAMERITYVGNVARSCTLGVLIFAIVVILLLSANVALLALLAARL